jgi:hypothetical protein
VLTDGDLQMIPRVDPGCVDEVADCGLWLWDDGHWLIVDFATTQTSRDELEALESRRRSDRERKARERAKEAAKADNTADVTGQVTRTAQARQARRAGEGRTH